MVSAVLAALAACAALLPRPAGAARHEDVYDALLDVGSRADEEASLSRKGRGHETAPGAADTTCAVSIHRGSHRGPLLTREDLDRDARTPCDPSKCKEDVFFDFIMAPHLMRVHSPDAANGHAPSCSCWEKPGPGSEGYLFSFPPGAGGCTPRACWEEYAKIVYTYSTGEELDEPPTWTTSCQEVPEGESRDDPLPSLEYLRDDLWVRGEKKTAKALVRAASPDMDGMLNGDADTGPPGLLAQVLGKIAGGWERLTSGAFGLLEKIGLLGLDGITGGSSEQVVLGSTFTWENYYRSQVQFLIAGLTSSEAMRQWYKDLPGTEKVKTGPGPNATLYLGYDDVRGRLGTVCEKLVSGKAVRQNELGIALQNGAMWPNAPGGERTIFLGSNVDNHAFVRPLLAKVLDLAERGDDARCDGSQCWNRAWLSERARHFVGERFKIDSSDFKWYVTQVLHKVHMNIDLSEAEAREFADYMGKVILPVALPEGQIDTWALRAALGISETQGRRSAYLERYRAAIRAKFPDRSFTYAQADQVASGFLDALQFAGGVAVPSVMQYVVALTHMQDEDKWEQLKGLRLSEENIPSVVWETLRVYPPVGTFPYWEKDDDGDWKHIMLNVASALSDEGAWEDPLTFKFRPMQEYKQKSVAFAEGATHPPTAAGGAGPHEHACPGKNLALAIIETLLKEFEAVGPWYAANPKISVNAYMTSSYSVVRQDHACWDAPSKCKPTFTYEGRQFHGCTTVDYDQGAWCSTTEVYGRSWKKCKPKLCRRSPCCCKTSTCSSKAILEGYVKETHGAGAERAVCCKRHPEGPGSGECPGNWLFGSGYYKPAEDVDPEAGDGLCPAHDYAEQPPPYSPAQAEIDAIEAAHECQQTGDGGHWRADCICRRASENWQPGDDIAALVHRCTALTAVAMEVAAPWGCSVHRRTMGGQTLSMSCEPSAPLHVRLEHRASQAWDSLTRWGTELFAPTDQCQASSAQCCSQSVLGTRSATCQDFTSQTLSSAWQDLPPQLQGVFWLQKQGDASALMSFGRTADGCGLSPGRIPSDATYKVRVGGDRSWSFHSTDGGSFGLVESIDLLYDFLFDSATDPKFAQIVPEARNVLGVRAPSWLLSFNMSLLPLADTPHPGSVVWRRQSSVPVIGLEVTDSDYHLVQVINGAGQRLPAFADWVKYCEDPELTGESSPGKIWYHAFSG